MVASLKLTFWLSRLSRYHHVVLWTKPGPLLMVGRHSTELLPQQFWDRVQSKIIIKTLLNKITIHETLITQSKVISVSIEYATKWS